MSCDIKEQSFKTLSECKKLFCSYDITNAGFIFTNKLNALFWDIDKDMSYSQVEKIRQELDPHNYGIIVLIDFLKYMTNQGFIVILKNLY